MIIHSTEPNCPIAFKDSIKYVLDFKRKTFDLKLNFNGT